MATLGNTPRPAYVYDTETDTWVPIGVGAHTHDYIPNTLVDAKGDILTATADNTPAKLSKGADGTVLVSDSTTSTGLAWQPYAAPQSAGKNYLINGGFDIWQRYTAAYSGTPTANTIFYNGVDRWFYATGTGSNSVTFDRVTAENTDTTYGIKFGRNSGATNTSAPTIIGQNIESINARRLAGKTVTLSFYAKTLSSFGNSLSVYLITGTGTNDSSQSIFGSGFTGQAAPINIGQSITTTMTRYSFTTTLPSNINQLAVMFSLYVTPATAGANEYIQMEKIQLEEGTIATSFSRAQGTIQGELAACQRYYYRTPITAGSSNYANGGCYISTLFYYQFNLPVSMRIIPTSVDYSNLQCWDVTNNIAVTSMTIVASNSQTNLVCFEVGTAGSGITYRPYVLRGNGSTNYIGVSAEL